MIQDDAVFKVHDHKNERSGNECSAGGRELGFVWQPGHTSVSRGLSEFHAPTACSHQRRSPKSSSPCRLKGSMGSGLRNSWRFAPSRAAPDHYRAARARPWSGLHRRRWHCALSGRDDANAILALVTEATSDRFQQPEPASAPRPPLFNWSSCRKACRRCWPQTSRHGIAAAESDSSGSRQTPWPALPMTLSAPLS